MLKKGDIVKLKDETQNQNFFVLSRRTSQDLQSLTNIDPNGSFVEVYWFDKISKKYFNRILNINSLSF